MRDTDTDAVLAANLDFYQAFTSQDFAAMTRIWAQRAPVTCIHPGWSAIAGRAAVLESWRDILGNPEAPSVACHDDEAFLHGEFALVLCEEEVSGGHLAASNVFVREDGEWRMVHHQASPLLVRGIERQRSPR
jgi:ketosteroid isomerase-like protein